VSAEIPKDRPERILRLPDVSERTGLRRSTIYNYIGKGTFPPSIKLGSAQAVGWLESEVQQWTQAQVRASRGESQDSQPEA